ncbi:hypothetical protein TNCT_509991 [Trichonephila clavata]|uniref:Uncharacterized protein n=1 Tax=Trichonephila clavata TaxID=2740835 RepID=A0A8X6FKW2_TRICU|nr:hypothetical protein TNCT_509991 [Trichonephila clavata]
MTTVIPCLLNVTVSYRFETLSPIPKYFETFMEGEKDKSERKEKWPMLRKETDFGGALVRKSFSLPIVFWVAQALEWMLAKVFMESRVCLILE